MSLAKKARATMASRGWRMITFSPGTLLLALAETAHVELAILPAKPPTLPRHCSMEIMLTESFWNRAIILLSTMIN